MKRADWPCSIMKISDFGEWIIFSLWSTKNSSICFAEIDRNIIVFVIWFHFQEYKFQIKSYISFNILSKYQKGRLLDNDKSYLSEADRNSLQNNYFDYIIWKCGWCEIMFCVCRFRPLKLNYEVWMVKGFSISNNAFLTNCWCQITAIHICNVYLYVALSIKWWAVQNYLFDVVSVNHLSQLLHSNRPLIPRL